MERDTQKLMRSRVREVSPEQKKANKTKKKKKEEAAKKADQEEADRID